MKPIRPSYRIFALTMAFLVFFSSVGFSIDMHFCQGQFKSFSLTGKAKSCHDTAKTVTCPHHQKMMVEQSDQDGSVDKKDCCESKTHHFQADQDQLSPTAEFTANQELQQFVVAYIALFFPNELLEEEHLAFRRYKPPLISRDIPVFYESFLL